MGLLDAPTLSKRASDQRYGVGDCFNFRTDNIRRIQYGLGDAVAGRGFCDLLVIGDSASSNITSVPPNTNQVVYPVMWPRQMENRLNARGVPKGGSGWVYPSDSPSIAQDPRWTIVSGWSKQGSYLQSSANGSVVDFLDVAVTNGIQVQIAYLNSNAAGSFTVAIDGTVVATVSTTNANTVGVWTSGALTAGVHKVRITSVGTPTLALIGAQVSAASGLRIHNESCAGYQAVNTGGWANSVYPQRGFGVKGMFASAAPHGVFIGLGGNDFMTGGATISTFKTAMTSIRNDYPNSDVILLCEHQPNNANTTDAVWAQYKAAMYDLAMTFDCPLVDVLKMVGGSYTTALANNLIFDGIHFHTGMQSLLGNAIANKLMAPAA
jgi:hypothetical protein